jgi:uncharacterized protein YjbI with pentapeptide repeats
MKRTLTALTVAASLMASGASAFDATDVQSLKDTGKCVGCDLSRSKLNGLVITTADATLDAANLSKADLSDAFLAGISLVSSNLEGAVLVGVHLEGADLTRANLRGANLDGANLTGADLQSAYMQGAILCNTTMPDGTINYSGC